MEQHRQANGRTGRSRVWVIIGATYTALFTAWIVADIGGHVVTRAFDDFAIMAAAVAAGAVCLSTSRRAVNGTNRSWLLLGLACETWAVGQCIWAVYQNVLGRPTPFPSLADVSYLAATPLTAAAVLIYPFDLHPVSRARSAVDCSLIALSLFFISWVSLLGPTWDAGTGPLLTQAVGVAYPLGNLTVSFLVIAKLARSPRSDRAPVFLIASGLLVLAVTQSAFIVLSLRGAYQTGSLIDPGYVVAFALIAVAASRTSPDPLPTPSASLAAPAAWMQLLPHLAGGAAVAAAVWVAEARGINGFMIAVLSAVALLSLIRQALLTQESRCAETALAKAANELAEAQALAHVGSWERDTSSGQIRWSDELYRIVGLQPGDLERSEAGIRPFLHPDDALAFESMGANSGEQMDCTVRLIRPSGVVRWVQVQGHMAAIGSNHGTRMIGTVQDVTERHKSNEELRQAQRMEAVGQLAGGIAHEFNNLLMSVLGYGEVALATLPPGAPARRSLEAIRVAGVHASELTKQLLVFSRQQDLETLSLDLNDVVRSVCSPGGLVEVDVPVEIVLEPGLPPVIAARAQIEQVLLHLVLNASDVLPSGGGLRIKTSYYGPDTQGTARAPDQLSTGTYALLTVSDTSGGMDPDAAIRSMESFFTTKGDRHGKGLGLAMVYGIVTQLGGALTASPGEECGSGFRVYLPFATKADVESRSSMTPVTATSSL